MLISDERKGCPPLKKNVSTDIGEIAARLKHLDEEFERKQTVRFQHC